MIHDLVLTRHAEARLRQRGLRDADVDLLLRVAEPVADDVLLLTQKRAAREIERRRREIQMLERLRGKKLVVANGTLVTAYHQDRSPKRGRQCHRKGRKVR